MRKTVVYIDDEPLLCEVFEEEMQFSKVPIVTFSDPESGIKYIQGNASEICAVFLDYRLRGFTGIDIIKRLSMKLNYFIVTGDLTIVRDHSLGVQEILAKPIDFTRVRTILGELQI